MTKPKTAPETALATIDPLNTAIATATEASDIPALKGIRAELVGLQKYAKARGASIEQENTIAEAILRDERGIGKVLIDMAETGQRMPRGGPGNPKFGRSKAQVVAADNKAPELSDLGLTRDESSKFQRLARVPEEAFEASLSKVKAIQPPVRISKVDFYRLDQSEKIKAEAKAAIREEEEADDPTSVFAAFEKATETLIAGMSQLPDDELVLVAGLIKRLADAYTVERGAR